MIYVYREHPMPLMRFHPHAFQQWLGNAVSLDINGVHVSVAILRQVSIPQHGTYAELTVEIPNDLARTLGLTPG